MSKEMLPEKMNGEHSLGPVSAPIIKEEMKKRKREGIIVILLMAVGIGSLVLASAFLMPYLNSLRASVPYDVSSTEGSGRASVDVIAPLSDTFKVSDIGGGEIDLGEAIATSHQITFSGYTGDVYTTDLRCVVDALPVYCDGSPITITGLPDGDHELKIVEPGYGGPVVHVFNWKTIT
ncbi:MAG: hypothetical protein M3270_04315 [Thermoproteota archaeon]|nr:hypothetical protein [Thermoproteota archaeon]